MTVNPVCEHVETSQGVPLTVTGVAQIKIMRADDLLKTAAEQFLGVPVNQLRSTVNQTLEGHLRAILGNCFPLLNYFHMIGPLDSDYDSYSFEI